MEKNMFVNQCPFEVLITSIKNAFNVKIKLLMFETTSVKMDNA